MGQIKLSAYAKIFYYEWKLNPQSYAYNIVFDQTLSKTLDKNRLELSLNRFVNDHLLFSCHIEEFDDEVFWKYSPQTVKLNYIDDASLVTDAQLISYLSIPFDLNAGPLYRFYLLKTAADQYRFVVVLHHILIDGDSGNDFVFEISSYYNYPTYTFAISLDDQSKLYSELATKLDRQISLQQTANEKFWDNIVEDDNEIINYNFLKINSNVGGLYPATINYQEFRFSFISLDKLGILKNKRKISPYKFSQIVYAILLHKYTEFNKIILNYPVAIKDGTKLIFGAHINTNLIRFDFMPMVTINELLKQSENYYALINDKEKKHNYYPIYSIVNTNNHGILNAAFAKTNLKDTEFTFDNVSVILVNHVLNVDLIGDLIFELESGENGLNYRVRYDANIIDKSLLAQFIKSYNKLFDEILNDVIKNGGMAKLPQDYSLLDNLEYQKIIYDWNQTDRDYPHTKTIHQFFEEQVVRTPDNIAVVYEDKKLTYRELNERANQLARYLKDVYVIKPDDLIALCLERSEYTLIAILAVLKSGAAYVPMDPEYPEERIRYILEDTRAKVLITDQRLSSVQILSASELIRGYTRLIIIDNLEFIAAVNNQPTSNLQTKTISANLAYVIYTSGTTGLPKGVMIEHRSVINLFFSLCAKYSIHTDERFLLFSNYVFDASVEQMMLSLLSGSILFVPSHKLISDPVLLTNYINDNKVTHFNATSTYLSNINFKKISTLNRIISGGETISLELCNELAQYKLQLINAYGPTESTITVTLEQFCYGLINSIGKPLNNIKIYILNGHLHLVPVGIVGELYIGGSGLARGYLNQPELTAEKFIDNPFQSEEEKQQGKNARLYKTGDLVRYLPDGNIEYMGRNDNQVKIRGYRIELGEIESALSQYQHYESTRMMRPYFIKQNVVLALEHKDHNGTATGNKYLVGYYVSESKLDEDDILSYLATQLPEYMVPSILVHLTSLPLTINGKLDRKALPVVEFSGGDLYEAPRNELEQKICDIYAEVLGLESGNVSIRDDFFKLGGNSILSIKLVSRINTILYCNINVQNIFTYRTIMGIAQLVTNTQGQFVYEPYHIKFTDRANQYEPFPLNNVQQAYYLGRLGQFELGNIGTHGYSELKFGFIDTQKLESALNYLIDRHLILRTIFVGGFQQALASAPHYTIAQMELKTEQELLEVRAKLSHKVYSVDKFPLFDFMVSKYNHHYILHISMDALLMDDSSFNLFLNELTILYNNPKAVLPMVNITFRDYIIELTKIRESKLFIDAQQYWINKLPNYNFEMNLPLACDISEVKDPVFSRISKVISFDIWDKIESQAKKYNIGLTSVLILVYGKVLSYWTGQSSVCINLTLFNRLPLHEQINDILGDFTVLELFNYQNANPDTMIIDILSNTHKLLWDDIEHNLFDGIDLQRYIRQDLSFVNNRAIAPVVLTSVLGSKHDGKVINDTYEGLLYSITQTSQVWLDNKAYVTDEGFIAEWDYVEQLFNRETMEAMHAHYCQLIGELAGVDWELSPAPNLEAPPEHLAIINAANSMTQEITIDTLFGYYERFVNNTHLLEKTAIIDANSIPITYKQLIYESEMLAKYLIQHDFEPNKLMPVMSEKGYNQVVATLAIMKSGGAYLPLNVDWPGGRIDEILLTADVNTILISRTQHTLFSSDEAMKCLGKYNQLIIESILDDIRNDKNLICELDKIKLPCVTSNGVAYVIFTSGSTGVPKGVSISHSGALNTIMAVNQKYQITNQDSILALSELSFDLSVYDIFGLLAVGGTIVFPSQEVSKDPVAWLKLINTHQITMWNSVPQLALLLVEEASRSDLYIGSLRLFLLSGDWIPITLPEKIVEQCHKSVVVSLGGATEGSIWSIWYDINKVDSNWNSIPYGGAMPNQQMYVLNNELAYAPIGVVGDIYIGGAGVALNYYGDKEKTKASFIDHTFLGRIYKTGDLGKWNKTGYIEFMGRKDGQVKINGYRVELEEIAAKLSRIPGVEEAMVRIQKQNNSDYLVAYLLPNQKLASTDEIESSKQLKLSSSAIKSDLDKSYQLDILLDTTEFRLHKSYRQYNASRSIDTNIIKEEINNVVAQLHKESFGLDLSKDTLKVLKKDKLSKLLGKLACVALEGKLLPKYLYPSAGSSYCVRTYLNLNNKLGDLDGGYYYYNPCELTLCSSQRLFTDLDNAQSFDFIAYWPAIKPFYHEYSRRFAYIEVGHMLSLLQSELRTMNIHARIELYEEDIDDENTLIARLILFKDSDSLAHSSKLNTLTKSANGIYSDLSGTRRVDATKNSVFVQASSIGVLLETGGVLLTLEGEHSIENFVYAGMCFQDINRILYKYNFGACMLGYPVYKDVLYAMVIGVIDNKDKLLPQSDAPIRSLKECIEGYLAKQLQDYMLPYDYIVLDTVPLTSNGKLDTNKLPLLELKSATVSKILPHNELEHNIRTAFAEILKLDEDSICVQDDFFKIGGNSLSAMQLIGVLNAKFGWRLTLLMLYANRSIKDLATIIQSELGTDNDKDWEEEVF